MGLDDLPNLRHLRAFSLTARYRSVKQAASAVYISQPAVTQAICKLETQFGVSFFQRRKTGMYCTPYGEAFRFRVDRAIAEIARACTPDGARPPTDADDPGRMISTAQLRAVIAIADQGNFTLAARALGISQPSMHRTARSLELALGMTLFIRSGQGIGLSPTGQRFARSAKLAVREIELAFEDLEMLRGQKTGRLAVGVMPLARASVVPQAVTRLLDSYPDLQVSIVDGAYGTLLQALRGGDIDVLVGALRDSAPMPDVIQAPLFGDALAVVARPDHPLTRIGPVQVTDTLGYPWIVPPQGTPTRDQFHALFAHRALAEPKRLLEASSSVTVRALLMDSNRLALISRAQIRFEVDTGHLVMLPVDLPETARIIGTTTRADWVPTRPQQAFVDLLTQCASELAPQAAPDEAPARRASALRRIRTGTDPAPE